MDRQSASMHGMHNMHNTFWLENQVIVTFYSPTPLIGADGVNNGQPILKQMDLPLQLQKLNEFLKENHLDFTLSFYEDEETSPEVESSSSQLSSSNAEQQGRDFNPPPGVYLFGFKSPIQSDFGEVGTSIVSFFNFKRDTASNTPSMGTATSSQGREPFEHGKADDDDEHEDHDEDDKKHRHPTLGPVTQIVNLFNASQEKLNNERQVPISAASPVWLCGATGSQSPIPQGCPLTPPMSVEDSCSSWHITLPDLSPEELQTMTGEGVTVFVLDTLPDREVIANAAEEAGDDNLLLPDVNGTVTFNYSFKPHKRHVPGSQLLATGKDIYGRHATFKMPDHGLFIAGIVHDIAPRASIECIRVLNEYCIGDWEVMARALQYIATRMSPGGDLYEKPVVINMSLVVPTKEEAKSKGVDPDLGGINNDIETCLRQPMQSLVQLGAVFVASAGNERDPREDPSGIRPMALPPAAFASAPYFDSGIIPVGAVNGNGNPTSYSCYPGSRGIATYGGEVPSANPPNPPSNDPIVTISDALRGVYSSREYPPLSIDPPALDYNAPNDHAWAYWVGTSFAAPIITGVAARLLELKASGGGVSDIPAAVLAAAGPGTTQWSDLDPMTTGVVSGSATGAMILAVQECVSVDDNDEDQEEVDIEIIEVVRVEESGKE